MRAEPARATATTTTIAVSDLGASNATARRRSLAARAQGNTTGTTAHGGTDRLRCQGTCQRRFIGFPSDRLEGVRVTAEGAVNDTTKIDCIQGLRPAPEDCGAAHRKLVLCVAEQKTKTRKLSRTTSPAHMHITHQPTTGNPHSCACACRRAARAMRAACQRPRGSRTFQRDAWTAAVWRKRQRQCVADLGKGTSAKNTLSFQLQHLVSFL